MHGTCKATMTQEYNIGVNLIVKVNSNHHFMEIETNEMSKVSRIQPQDALLLCLFSVGIPNSAHLLEFIGQL